MLKVETFIFSVVVHDAGIPTEEIWRPTYPSVSGRARATVVDLHQSGGRFNGLWAFRWYVEVMDGYKTIIKHVLMCGTDTWALIKDKQDLLE